MDIKNITSIYLHGKESNPFRCGFHPGFYKVHTVCICLEIALFTFTKCYSARLFPCIHKFVVFVAAIFLARAVTPNGKCKRNAISVRNCKCGKKIASNIASVNRLIECKNGARQ